MTGCQVFADFYYASCKGVFRTLYIPAGTDFSGSGGADGSQHYFYILFLSSTTPSCVYYLERVLQPVAFRSMSKRLLLTEKSYPIFQLKNAGGILSRAPETGC